MISGNVIWMRDGLRVVWCYHAQSQAWNGCIENIQRNSNRKKDPVMKSEQKRKLLECFSLFAAQHLYLEKHTIQSNTPTFCYWRLIGFVFSFTQDIPISIWLGYTQYTIVLRMIMLLLLLVFFICLLAYFMCVICSFRQLLFAQSFD